MLDMGNGGTPLEINFHKVGYLKSNYFLIMMNTIILDRELASH